MGWCSGTRIFDAAVREVVDRYGVNEFTLDFANKMRNLLEEFDWDCVSESVFFNDPDFKEIFPEAKDI
jgi:predicted SpoU family rRNA methylase